MNNPRNSGKSHSDAAKAAMAEARRREWAGGKRDHQRGQINTGRALTWKLRSPEGGEYLVESLEHWCRENEALFLPDSYPHSKNPLWMRAARGIAESIRKPGRDSWRGWQVVSKK